MTTLKTQIVLAGLLITAAPALRAEMLNGAYDIPSPANVNIWDVSGTYSEPTSKFTITNCTIAMDDAGKLTGTGGGYASNFEVEKYAASMSFTFTIKGAVQTSGNAVRGSMALTLKGTGLVDGYYATYTGTINEKLELDAADNEIVGTASGHISVKVPSVKKSGSGSIPTTDLTIPLGADASGLWDLNLSVSTNKTKYTGTGSIVLANTNTLPLAATGSYTAKSGLSKLTFKGQGVAKAVSLALSAVCTNNVVTVKTLSGKAMGQTIKYTAP